MSLLFIIAVSFIIWVKKSSSYSRSIGYQVFRTKVQGGFVKFMKPICDASEPPGIYHIFQNKVGTLLGRDECSLCKINQLLSKPDTSQLNTPPP